MSHIGKAKIILLDQTYFNLSDYDLNYNLIQIDGKLGSLECKVHKKIKVELNDNVISLEPEIDTKYYKALWGLSRTLINNMIIGVSKGYTYKLSIVGIGYRASILDSNLILKIGFSHDITCKIPKDVQMEVINGTTIEIKGIDKQKVSSICNMIRSFKKPDSYKGKGIRFFKENVSLKQGKRG